MKNRGTWIAFIIGIILTVVVAFLIWPDKENDTHEPEHAQVMANDDSVRSHKAIYLFIIDSLNKDKRQLIAENTALKERIAAHEIKLNAKAAEVKTLAAQIKAMNKDTALNAKVDSLVNLVGNLNFFLVQYEVYTDSLNRVNAALQANYETKDQEKDKRIAELQAAYDSLFKAYQALFADSRVMAKYLKKQKLKTKIVGVLGAAAAVLGLIK